MWKKAIALGLVFCLLGSPLAFAANAADPASALTDNAPGQTESADKPDQRLLPPHARTRAFSYLAGKRLTELEQLQSSNPESLKQQLLAEHDQMVAAARKTIAGQSTLAQEIIDRVVKKQAEAVRQATEAAKADTKNPSLAAKRLAYAKAKQELAVALVQQNAKQMAEQMVAAAEEFLAQADGVRARIANGEGLQVIKEQRQQQAKHSKEPGKRPPNTPSEPTQQTE